MMWNQFAFYAWLTFAGLDLVSLPFFANDQRRQVSIVIGIVACGLMALKYWVRGLHGKS